jgi:hypothetical protein
VEDARIKLSDCLLLPLYPKRRLAAPKDVALRRTVDRDRGLRLLYMRRFTLSVLTVCFFSTAGFSPAWAAMRSLP